MFCCLLSTRHIIAFDARDGEHSHCLFPFFGVVEKLTHGVFISFFFSCLWWRQHCELVDRNQYPDINDRLLGPVEQCVDDELKKSEFTLLRFLSFRTFSYVHEDCMNGNNPALEIAAAGGNRADLEEPNAQPPFWKRFWAKTKQVLFGFVTTPLISRGHCSF